MTDKLREAFRDERVKLIAPAVRNWMGDKRDHRSMEEVIYAALAAAPQPAPEWEICEVCRGTGIAGHPDSGNRCYLCDGSGAVEPQPAVTDRQALVEVIAEARGRFTPAEMAWAGDGYHDEERAIADALLARGLRLPIKDRPTSAEAAPSRPTDRPD